jgi:hypothetical protein
MPRYYPRFSELNYTKQHAEDTEKYASKHLYFISHPFYSTDRYVISCHFSQRKEENNMALFILLTHQCLRNVSFQFKRLR